MYLSELLDDPRECPSEMAVTVSICDKCGGEIYELDEYLLLPDGDIWCEGCADDTSELLDRLGCAWEQSE